MTVWLIEPRDPIIFRDGKPFSATPGARAKSLQFPNPSTLAGAVRTREGQDDKGQFVGDPKELREQVGIRGPVLMEVEKSDGWYFPAPADCLLIEAKDEKEKAKRLWARPVETKDTGFTDLDEKLKLVSVCPVTKDKPITNAPRFWAWKTLKEWLLLPKNDETAIDPKTLGILGLTNENRMHVKIEPNAQTADEGMLFQTSGLEFIRVEEKKLSEAKQYALAVETNASLTEGVDFLGGERRMANWKQGDEFPKYHADIVAKIKDQKNCRLILATPALFDDGYLPKWIKTCTPGVTVEIIAAVVPRGTAVSGWDYANKQQKASRRLAPAGSVYYLKLKGEKDAISKFVDVIWMQNISDEDQDRRDGFGLALLGTWDGKIEPLRLENEK